MRAVDLDDSLPLTILSSSPPQSTYMDRASFRDTTAPPSAPGQQQGSGSMSPVTSGSPDLVDLQLDYWLVPSKQELVETANKSTGGSGDKASKKEAKECKNSLKMSFRTVQLYRLPSYTADSATLNMVVVTKEKKQKS